jgi:hypothetical protein
MEIAPVFVYNTTKENEKSLCRGNGYWKGGAGIEIKIQNKRRFQNTGYCFESGKSHIFSLSSFVLMVSIFKAVFVGTHLQRRSATCNSSLVAASSAFMPTLGSHEQLASWSASSALGASLPQPPPPSPKSWASSNQRSAFRAPSRSAPPIHVETRPTASEIKKIQTLINVNKLISGFS